MEKKQTLGLGLAIDVAGNDTPREGAEGGKVGASKLTPRASPRRAPELPTIREEIVVANLPGDPVAVPAAQCHGTLRHRFHLGPTPS